MKAVWHVYYATKGAAGNYIDALLSGSEKAGVKARAFVSCRYRYNTRRVVKCFFPLTDATEKRNRLIRWIRGAELAASYLSILTAAAVFRPRVVLHLIDDLSITYLFFRSLKFAGIQVYLTCHDVVPQYTGMTARRLKLLNEADGLIVHSGYALGQLRHYLKPKTTQRMLSYPFPSRSYEAILSASRLEDCRQRIEREIGEAKNMLLFLGVVKLSKGIDTLLEAWSICRSRMSGKLVIAGRWAGVPQEIIKSARRLPNVTIFDRYLSDEEFVTLINIAKFIVLPYRDYAHSSVLVSCANHGGAVITSDIQLFDEILPNCDMVFPKEDAQQLADVIDRATTMPASEVGKYRIMLRESVQKMDERLVSELRAAYIESGVPDG